MSGGPVYIEQGGKLSLLGVYNGLIYPDNVIEKNEPITALGSCTNLGICWNYGADTSLKSYSEIQPIDND